MSFTFTNQPSPTFFDQDNQVFSTIRGVSVLTKSVDVTSVTAATCLDFDVTGFKGLRAPSTSDPGDIVIVHPQAAMTANVGITTVRIKDAGTVTIRVCNPTAGAIDPAAVTMTFVIFHTNNFNAIGS